MFVDEAEILVRAGAGGNGCVAFLREKFRPKGGPAGGNGGRGGSVMAVASADVQTLMDFSGRYHWIARSGEPGEGKEKSGLHAEDLIILLPVGTLIYDRNSGVLLKDLTEIGDRVCLARGGAGGRGNKTFATPTHQSPREAEPGELGEERVLRLELKLIADVGFVGLPNAGKSTLLAALSKAHPKIAPYPFTTLAPQLGIIELSDYRRLVAADIPGLIEGAHEGQGLGDAFLRHIERTRVIVHLVDVAPPDGSLAALAAYRVIRGELAKFSAALAEKPEIVVANKCDLDHDGQALRDFAGQLGQEVIGISAATRRGLDVLTERMWRVVAAEKPPPAPAPEMPQRVPPHLKEAQ